MGQRLQSVTVLTAVGAVKVQGDLLILLLLARRRIRGSVLDLLGG